MEGFHVFLSVGFLAITIGSEHHEHGPPEVEPDENDYSAIHQLIVGVAIFVVISMAGVAVWLDAEIEHVTASSVAGAAQE